MGTAPSKEGKNPDPPRNERKGKPVANVNNRNAPANNNSSQQKQPAPKTFITQPDETLEERNNSLNTSKNQVAFGGNSEGTSVDRPSRRTDTTREQESFVWTADQETQDELNEVLQIPTENRHTSSRPVHAVNPVRQEDLPETYAQRKQRQQYTVNQHMLLRQKTIYRNPDDWKNQEEETATNAGGFDPSKFRSVNKGQSVSRSTVFTTSDRQDGSVQYMPGQNMDEFDVTPRQHGTPRELPTYNQSEQDLMASLERELM